MSGPRRASIVMVIAGTCFAAVALASHLLADPAPQADLSGTPSTNATATIPPGHKVSLSRTGATS